MSKPILADADYCRAAERLGCEPAAIAAVAQQESLGAGFDAADRPTVLFERHIFHRLTGGIYDHSHPNISNANQGGYGRSREQYGRFSIAFDLNADAAMKATSWGKFQILGRNYKICGFATVGAFVDAMKLSEGSQLDIFCAFVLANGLDQYLTDREWALFANGYNGTGYRKNHYDTKIAANFTVWSKHNFNCSLTVSTEKPQNSSVDPSTEKILGTNSSPSDISSGSAADDSTPEEVENTPETSLTSVQVTTPQESQPLPLWTRAWNWITCKQATLDQISSLRNSLNPFTPSISPISGSSSVMTATHTVGGAFVVAFGMFRHYVPYLLVGMGLVGLGAAIFAFAKRNSTQRLAIEASVVKPPETVQTTTVNT